MSRKVLWGIVAGALVIAGYLYWVSDGKHTNLAVGDCVSVSGSGQLDVVDCGAGSGVYKIIAEYDGTDSNQCDAVTGTVKSFVISQSGSGGLVLCAGDAK
ncbi:hypothetical protein KDL01_00280 [Actinospica durhamensis]|uniref:Uncharacterized protein n=1 Tax=Actinospica durhamensis TaxID=1508375 RepID=A0A941IN55_9ACTN|nr:hypothetical protein [Actinospica durhamensis]MBR7831672.1 hypothetical protein [Actinospica durhamensis]